MESFDPNDAVSIKSAQEAFANPNVLINLTYIKTYFHVIPEILKKIETKGMPLADSLMLVENIKDSLDEIPGALRTELLTKFNAVLQRNPAFNTISKINRILRNETTEEDLDIEVKSCYWSKYKYAPITSCDVERSFSAYKLILSDKRHQFTVDNIEKVLVVYCDLNYNNEN